MAVIRPTAPRRFRHYGSPEQGSKSAVRSGMRRLLSFMGLMTRRWLLTVTLGWIVTLVVALVASPLVWWGWNHGVAPAFNAPPVDWFTAYALAAFVSTFAGMFKSSLTVNTREE